jgi:hypothetical protein
MRCKRSPPCLPVAAREQAVRVDQLGLAEHVAGVAAGITGGDPFLNTVGQEAIEGPLKAYVDGRQKGFIRKASGQSVPTCCMPDLS